MRARRRERDLEENGEQDYPENEKEEGRVYIYEVRANKFRRVRRKGRRALSISAVRACMLHRHAFRRYIRYYNNNNNCDKRQIAEATITLLNRETLPVAAGIAARS